MGLPLTVSAQSIGNDAGWALAFYKEHASGQIGSQVCRFSREGYYASIDATLPNDLAAGTYTFVIEGLKDSDHLLLRGQDRPTVVRLYLYWRDVNSSVVGYLANVAGITDLLSGGGLAGAATGALGGSGADPLASVLIAELAITSVTRQVGHRRYETKIEAVERVYARVNHPLRGPLGPGTREDAATRIGTLASVTVNVTAPTMSGSSGSATENFTQAAGASILSALQTIARDYEQASNRYGRGQLLISKGQLYVGVRQIPLNAPDIPLDLADGLVETKLSGQVSMDPTADPSATPPPGSRNQYQLTLKGRPDILPGSVVSFEPPADADSGSLTPSLGGALAGAIGGLGAGGALIASLTGSGTKVRGYVSSVRHRLSRESGFSTVVTAVEIAASGDDGWDHHPPLGSRGAAAASSGHTAGANPAQDVARSVQHQATAAAARVYTTEVGEVRAVHPTGTSEPPGQTDKVWRGLVAPDGNDRQARRLDIERDHPEALDGVPYASPFAWGNCGLILPRYPGTRVVLVHRNGQASDPIDVGALWQSGTASSDAQAGDYWLALPTEAAHPDSLDDSASPDNYTGKASNDLIDAAGNRTLEVAGLTIRVGKDALNSAGQRPAPPFDDEALTIEHGDGQAKIVLKKGGEIEIRASKITLATDGVTATLDSSGMDVS
jgi:hypothetical protein